MRIAMIGQKGFPAQSGGIEQAVEMLSRQLVARGHRVTVYCRRSYWPEGVSRREAGVDCVYRPSIATKHLDAITHACASTLDVVLRRADVVHYHAIGPAALAPLARLAGLPVVVTVHGLDWQRAKWGPVARRCLKMGQAIAARTARELVVVAPSLQAFFADQFGVQSHFIPNGVVPIPTLPAAQITHMGLGTRQFLLSVARLVPEKGLHYLIEAFCRTSHALRLVIAGGGGFDPHYERQLRRMADERVLFTGPADRRLLAELYSHALLFVLPSDVEGMSLALLEAMSMGLPVLVSDIAENTSVVEQAGFTFRAADVNHLQHTLERVLADRAALSLWGSQAALRAAQFSWPQVVDQLEQVYARCLRRPAGSLARAIPEAAAAAVSPTEAFNKV